MYLTGSHNWSNFQLFEDDDFGTDKWYEDYLDFLNKFNHNFTRLWMWECGYGAEWMLGWREDKKHVSPLPFKRIADGWFDLMSFNEEFFEILRKRVVKAKEHGIYVSVMLFQGWDVERKGRVVNPFDAHPFNRKNNTNGIDGDPHNLNEGIYVHTLENPSITGIQESYVRKVIETLNDLDNVLYEVSNESCRKSTEWQYHMINFIHEYEEGQMEKRHPVGMTFTWSDKWIGSNADLFNSPAEWISPNPEAWSGYDYRYNPPPADGRKIVILDTDHLWE